jgi:trk system potassium uptake protein TrkA
VAVSERDVMARQILGFLNTGPVISRTNLPGGNLGVYELEVIAESRATEHVLANLKLPPQCLIVAVIREDFVRVPGADDRLQAGDTVLALVEESVVDEAVAQFHAPTR